MQKKFKLLPIKLLLGGHIAYCVIGEETAKNDLNEIVGYFATDEQIRYSGNVYIVKNSTAKDFFEKTVNPSRKLGQKLDSMEENIKFLSIVSEYKITDLLELVASKKQIGLIPVLEEIKEKEGGNNKESNSSLQDFDFSGYGIIQNAKLIDYLNKEESRSCNFIKNKTSETVIVLNSIEKEENDITLSTMDSKCNLEFIFNSNDLEKIKLDLKVKGNIEEISFGDEIYTDEEVAKLEEELNEVLKEQLKNVIDKSQKMNIDFLDISKVLERKHPFKYEKIKENWNEIWPKIEVQVNVESQIQRKYDLIKTKE